MKNQGSLSYVKEYRQYAHKKSNNFLKSYKVFMKSDMFQWWPLPSSTSDGRSEQRFVAGGALACSKWTFPVDDSGYHRNMLDFYEHLLTF